jgi:ABC-type taurine transport system ATPase subunit
LKELLESLWSTVRLWQRVLHYCSERVFRQLLDLIFSSYNARVLERMPWDLADRYLTACQRVIILEQELKAAQERAGRSRNGERLRSNPPCPESCGTETLSQVACTTCSLFM